MADWWQDPAFLTTLTGLVAIIGVLVGGLLWLWRWSRNHDRVHKDVEALPAKVDDLNAKVSALLAIEVDRTPTLWDKVKAYSPPKTNPYDPRRKNLLLDRMRGGTIGLDEAHELENILQEDLGRARAEKEGAGAGVILAILAILGALAAVIYLLTRKEQ